MSALDEHANNHFKECFMPWAQCVCHQKEAIAELAALHARMELLVGLLKESEWTRLQLSQDGDYYCCWICKRSKQDGHAPDCRYDKAVHPKRRTE